MSTTVSAQDARGIVRPWVLGRAFELQRIAPAPALERLVERHWVVRWDLTAPFRQETLPHPSVNLVIEPAEAWVWGIPTGMDVRILRDAGWAVGTKFRAGAFTGCTGIEASAITDGRISLRDAFGDDPALALLARAGDDEEAILDALEILLAGRLTRLDPAVELVQEVIEHMRAAPLDTRVEAIASAHHIAARTLQRLFRRYVGVSPKWVLKRMRIHHAAEQLAAPDPPVWTALALELGYYDHAHFIRDFRQAVGRSPAEYVAEAAAGRGA